MRMSGFISAAGQSDCFLRIDRHGVISLVVYPGMCVCVCVHREREKKYCRKDAAATHLLVSLACAIQHPRVSHIAHTPLVLGNLIVAIVP